MAKSMTGLMIASWHGNIKIVKELIKAGADVNARLADGRTALILAIEQDQSQCTALLIKAGADVNITADTNLSHSNCMKSFQDGSDGNQVKSNQLGHNHNAADDLPAKKEDVASANGGKKATVPYQEILVDDNDDDSNDRRKTPSPENGNENHFGKDSSSPRIALSAAMPVRKTREIAPVIGKTPKVRKFLTIPQGVFKASTKTSAVRKYSTVTMGKYPTITPAMGHISTVLETLPQAMRKAPETLMQPPAIIPTIGQHPAAIEPICQGMGKAASLIQPPTINQTMGQYPTVTPAMGPYPAAIQPISQVKGKSLALSKPPNVFLKIVPAAENTQSVYQVLSPGVFFEMPPVTSKSSVAVPAVSTITTTVPGTVPAVVPEFWRAPAGTTTPAVAPAVKKNPAENAALVKARAVGKDTVETPLDLLKKVSSFQNTPARRKKPAASSPVVSTGATPVFPAETRAKVSARALGVFPPKTQAVVPSVQTTTAIVSSGAPAEASSVQTTPTLVSAGAPTVFPREVRTIAPSVQTATAVGPAGAPAGTRAKFSARYPGVFPAETRAKAPSVHTTPTIVSAAVEDELMRRNSISAESSRRSRTLNRSNFDDRRLRSRSRSDYSDGDWLVHKKRRRTFPVKVKQEPTGGDENDVDMKSETRGTDAATLDDSGHDNSNNHNSDSSVKIKQEPSGSDEKYVGMNSKNNDKRINESNNNDNVYTEDWFARVLSRYPPSSFLRSTSTSPSTYPSSLFGHGEKSCSDKGRRHHQKRHHRSESKGEDSPAAKRKKKKKKDRESPPVKVK